MRAPSAQQRGGSGVSAEVAQPRQVRARICFGLALISASLQVAIATRWEGRSEYISVLVLGSCGALFLAVLRRMPILVSPGRIATVLGALVWAAACLTAAGTHAAYHTVNRFLPLVAGLGLVVMWSGVRGAVRFWRELMLLTLPLLYPLPFAIKQALMPTRLTAATVGFVLRMMGVSVTRDGTLLVFPESTLRVFDLCSGIVLMTQALVLAVLVLAFFPTTFRRAALVVLGGLGIGFLVNAGRIALLAVVASHMPSEFDYWEEYVAGSVWFPLLAVALCGLMWWRMLRMPVGGQAESPGT